MYKLSIKKQYKIQIINTNMFSKYIIHNNVNQLNKENEMIKVTRKNLTHNNQVTIISIQFMKGT